MGQRMSRARLSLVVPGAPPRTPLAVVHGIEREIRQRVQERAARLRLRAEERRRKWLLIFGVSAAVLSGVALLQVPPLWQWIAGELGIMAAVVAWTVYLWRYLR